MSVLCQIALVDDEKQFMEYVKQYNHPPSGYGGWGRFYGEVPAIETTLQIDWSDYELENKVPFPEGRKNDQERASDYFRVIHHHRHLVPKPEYYSSLSSDTDEMKRALNVGHHAITLCVIYVIKV
jgi:hypothetical protein